MIVQVLVIVVLALLAGRIRRVSDNHPYVTIVLMLPTFAVILENLGVILERICRLGAFLLV